MKIWQVEHKNCIFIWFILIINGRRAAIEELFSGWSPGSLPWYQLEVNWCDTSWDWVWRRRRNRVRFAQLTCYKFGSWFETEGRKQKSFYPQKYRKKSILFRNQNCFVWPPADSIGKLRIFQFLENINIYNNSKSAIFNIKKYYVLVLLYFPKSW